MTTKQVSKLEQESWRIVTSIQSRCNYKAYSLFIDEANWYKVQELIDAYNELESRLDKLREKHNLFKTREVQ